MSRSSCLMGSCHCGAVKVQLQTSISIERFSPRVCDCSFCRKHGAAYISDPVGHLRIEVTTDTPVHEYRQGSENAKFLLCAKCGVLVAVVYDAGSKLYGALNASCLDDCASLGSSMIASPQKLNAKEKIDRWIQLWTPDVEIVAVSASK